jgi:transposase InsO family protein
MKSDIRNWVQYCQPCQRTKIIKHEIVPAQRIIIPPGRFQIIHLDLVGPLPPVDGYRFILTIIDRYTRWAEASPLKNQSAETVCSNLITTWIQRFGVPKVIITDRGSQFESALFQSLARYFGFKHAHTTSYNPQANGLIENLHRPLKAALKADRSKSWLDRLPVVMMAFRNQIKEDLRASPSQLVLGTNVHLPADFFENTVPQPYPSDLHEIVRRFDQELKLLKTSNTNTHSTRYQSFKLPGLSSCEWVWVKNNPGLTFDDKYLGPFQVTNRSATHFTIIKDGKEETVNRARLKPAYIENEDRPEDTGTFNPSIVVLNYLPPLFTLART